MSETENTPVTPTASPEVSSTIGLKNFCLAELVKDTEAELEYGTVQLVAGAIDASVTPSSADPQIQYYDDNEGDVVMPDPETSFKIKLADLPLAIRQKLDGSVFDNNGVLINKAGDKTPYYAAGFKALKANGKYRYVWLYKCRVKPVTDSYQTKEGTTITRQSTEVEFTAVKRAHDDQWRATADEGVQGFTAQKGAAFLNSVYAADFTEDDDDEDGEGT